MALPAPVGVTLIVCESLDRAPRGELTLNRILNRVVADKFPFTIPRLAIYLTVTDGRPGNRLQVQLVDGGTEQTLLTLAEFDLPNASGAAGTGVIDFDIAFEPLPYEFVNAGVYLIRVASEQTVVLQRPLLLETDCDLRKVS